MAIMSMTGFGRSESRLADHAVTVEIRTVNHRFFETSLRLPKVLAPSETKVKEALQKEIARGRVSVSIDIDGNGVDSGLTPDDDRIKKYVGAAAAIQKKHRLAGDLDINTLLAFPDIFRRDSTPLTEEEVWPVVEKGIVKALRGVSQMRRREGRALVADMRKRLAAIRSAVGIVEKRMPRRVAKARKELRKRIEEMVQNVTIPEDRVTTEIAILADRLDVTEEIVRARSHIDQFMKAFQSGEPVGRKLNFLLQELQREINTIGSKANDASVANEVVSMKEEVEKIREQVQNVE